MKKKMINRCFIIPIIIVLFSISTLFPYQAEKGKRKSKAETITLKELKEHVYFLASDELEGRMTCSKGYETAAQYIAKEIKAAGLKPVIKDSRGKKSFMQNVPFIGGGRDTTGQILIKTSGGTTAVNHVTDYKFLALGNKNFLGTSFPVVFAGFGIYEPDAGWNDFNGLDIKGKVVVVIPGVPTRNGEPVLPEELHNLYSSNRGRTKRNQALLEREPAFIIKLASAEISKYWITVRSVANIRRLQYVGNRNARTAAGYNSILAKKNVLESIFTGQIYSPLDMKENDIKNYKTFELENTEIEITMNDPTVNAWNIVAVVEGTDNKLKNEYVSVGAHLDHIGIRNGQICNGADDNASGCAGALEIAEAVVMNPPRRSVIFIFYTAEELGLIGSRHFVNNCPVPVDKIIANINLDMIGRTEARLKETRSHYVVDSKSISQELGEIIETVNNQTVNWPLTFIKQAAISGRSDHISFQQKGIPSAFFYSGRQPDIHRPTDDPDKIEYDKMEKISQLVYEIVMKLGNRDKKPVKDK